MVLMVGMRNIMNMRWLVNRVGLVLLKFGTFIFIYKYMIFDLFLLLFLSNRGMGCGTGVFPNIHHFLQSIQLHPNYILCTQGLI